MRAKLSELNCAGSENNISECASNTQDIGTCTPSVAVCQGEGLYVLHINISATAFYLD